VLLFSDLLDRVPAAAGHVGRVAAGGGRICFDHGALRTIDGAVGALPRGTAAFARILKPLGYRSADLSAAEAAHDRLCVRARDMPDTLPQFFVSELHIVQLPEAAQAAAERVFGRSVDPLGRARAGVPGGAARRAGGAASTLPPRPCRSWRRRSGGSIRSRARRL
jgi:hypothetical protein